MLKRSHSKFIGLLKIEDIYKEYIKTNPFITKKDFIKITDTYNKKLMNRVLNGEQVYLLHRIGTFFVNKKKTNLNTPRTDFKASKDNQTHMVHLNEHSDGFTYRIQWGKDDLKNVQVYSFMGSRDNKRKLAKIIKDGQDYFQTTKRLKKYYKT